MKRFRNLLLVLVALVGLAVMVSQLVLGKAIARQAQDCIKICDEVPLSTIVKNLVTVVGDVKISNDSESPIPTRVNGPIRVASSARDSLSTKAVLLVTDVFQREVKITLLPGDLNGTASFNVSQSRLLVIEGWAGSAQMGHITQGPHVHFKTTANGDPGVWPVFAQFAQFANPASGFLLSQPGWLSKVYADPSSTVEVTFSRSNPIGTATMTLTLTGHYIDQ